MASTLFIQVPPKSVADEIPEWKEQALPFCLASSDGHLQQHGRQNLQDLATLARTASQTVLLLASSDVSVFSLEVPPMASQKLKLALPNLLEDQVLTDPADLIFAAGPVLEGRCTVLTVQRSWMMSLLALAQTIDPRKLAAYPAALGMQFEDGSVSAMIENVWPQSLGLLVSIKTSANEFCGLSFASESTPAAFKSAIDGLRLFSGNKNVSLAVDASLRNVADEHSEQLASFVSTGEIALADWSRKIATPFPPSLNLLAELVQEQSASFDWSKWRWSITLVSSILLISIFGLNWEWYRLRSEANILSAGPIASYRGLFPNEPSLRDPIAQLQQKINQAKKIAGQSTDEDFLVMNGQLAQAWQVAFPQLSGASTSSIEYREKALFVKPKNSGELQVEPLRAALREYGLRVEAKDGGFKVSRDEGSVK